MKKEISETREVAEVLGMGCGSAVSKQLGRLEEKVMTDRNIARRIKQAEEQLDKKTQYGYNPILKYEMIKSLTPNSRADE